MSILIKFFILLLTVGLFSDVESQHIIQSYVIRKDVLNGIKAGEFSIFDTTQQHLYYRIESNYGLLPKIKLIAYPSKQIVARLEEKFKLFTYKANFSILDPQTDQWINGVIREKFRLAGTSLDIHWNGHHIVMKRKPFSWTSKVYDTDGELLAQFRTEPLSIFWSNKIDMKIFSSKYPKELYFLVLAARDQQADKHENK